MVFDFQKQNMKLPTYDKQALYMVALFNSKTFLYFVMLLTWHLK